MYQSFLGYMGPAISCMQPLVIEQDRLFLSKVFKCWALFSPGRIVQVLGKQEFLAWHRGFSCGPWHAGLSCGRIEDALWSWNRFVADPAVQKSFDEDGSVMVYVAIPEWELFAGRGEPDVCPREVEQLESFGAAVRTVPNVLNVIQ